MDDVGERELWQAVIPLNNEPGLQLRHVVSDHQVGHRHVLHEVDRREVLPGRDGVRVAGEVGRPQQQQLQIPIGVHVNLAGNRVFPKVTGITPPPGLHSLVDDELLVAGQHDIVQDQGTVELKHSVGVIERNESTRKLNFVYLLHSHIADENIISELVPEQNLPAPVLQGFFNQIRHMNLRYFFVGKIRMENVESIFTEHGNDQIIRNDCIGEENALVRVGDHGINEPKIKTIDGVGDHAGKAEVA